MLDVRLEGAVNVGTGDSGLFDHLHRTANFEQFEGNQLLRAAWLIRDGIQLSSSIDDFLDLHQGNPEVNLYGKAAIVKSILQAEQNSSLFFDRRKLDKTIDFKEISTTWLVKFMKIL